MLNTTDAVREHTLAKLMVQFSSQPDFLHQQKSIDLWE